MSTLNFTFFQILHGRLQMPFQKLAERSQLVPILHLLRHIKNIGRQGEMLMLFLCKKLVAENIIGKINLVTTLEISVI